MITFDREWPADSLLLDSLLDRAFGPDRTNKSSYSLRSASNALTDLSIMARLDGELVGSVQFWSISIVDMLSEYSLPAVLLGPLAIDPDLQGQGLGSELMRRALKMLDLGGYDRVLLVGDLEYYRRFGFERVMPRYISLPGRRDADRLLVRERKDSLKSLPIVGRLEIAPCVADADFAA
ncbi:N-acetyltransferase [Kordiimonas sediminis]|uniref:N-acetyltransferase n=1 Tax=Kordiimonas sediminis TaxID=1735581 RepID=A0A919E829_9PROT|nr:N-acetyltransferase [Kordiimonas sediminis]GHF23752.1 N-acetyltransferase [Kordiimonas sediminis]